MGREINLELEKEDLGIIAVCLHSYKKGIERMYQEVGPTCQGFLNSESNLVISALDKIERALKP